jgi:glycosyltransferase involved in cell wall biosynthesis
MSARPAIAIVAHNAYGPLAGSASGHIGGVEWQTSLTARWLASHGYAVSLVTWADGPPGDETIDGVRVVKVCRRDAGLRGLRFLHPRWTGLIAALGRADADVYYHNGAEEVTGQVGWWCRLKGRGFVFSSACDTDCDRRLPSLDARSRLLYRRGLRDAHARIVQTDTQQRMLRESFGLDSIVIPMPCPGPSDAEFVPRVAPASRRILWIARVTRQKRPDRLLDVARLRPDLQFDLVGPSDGGEYAQGVLAAARSVPNVTVHGAVPREKARAFFAGSALLLSTSDFEGFPNTFLEAWSLGLPIVSTFDPDTVIARHDLGFVAAEAADLARSIGSLLDGGGTYALKSAQARRYYREHHAAEAVLPRFEAVFREVGALRRP